MVEDGNAINALEKTMNGEFSGLCMPICAPIISIIPSHIDIATI